MTTEVRVSQTTMNFVNCMVELNKFHGKVYDALEAMYGEVQADKLMPKFYDATEAVRQLLRDYQCQSIEESINYRCEITEI